MRALLLAAVGTLAVLAATATPANATDFCERPALLTVGIGGDEVVHVAYDGWPSSYLVPSVWIYLESNGQPGLQRGGVTLLGDADVCQDSATPDTGIV